MLLSILIPGKNDGFFNALHKLDLNVKKTLSNIDSLGLNDVEVVLCDWGSEIKITEALNLSTNNTFKCVYVPTEITKKYNREADYSIVHPINTAFRHSRGRFVIFWDSDCYIDFESFKNLYNFVQKLDLQKSTTFYWGSRYNVAHTLYEDAKNYLEFDIRLQNSQLSEFYHDKIDVNNFGGAGASILMNRDLWESSTGWWEELIYWGWQDIEFHNRLKQRYSFGGDLEDYNIIFYHLCNESQKSQKLYNERRVNPYINSPSFCANESSWGLVNEPVVFY